MVSKSVDLRVEEIRNQLAQVKSAEPEKFIYFDNAATCLLLDPVIAAWKNYHQTCSGSPGRGTYKLANLAGSIYEESRQTIKDFLGVGSDYELVFTAGSTDALNKAAFGLSHLIKPGDIIVLSELEHNSNYLPWLRLAQSAQAYLEIIPWDKNGLDYSFFDLLDNRRVALIAITHTSNVNGYQPNLGLIRDFARKNHALIVMDAAQAAGHHSLQVDSLDVDLIAVSAHKMYGPKGIGGLIGKKDILAKLTPMILGGGAVHSVEGDDITYAKIPTCHEAGTRDVASAYAWAEACRYLTAHDFSGLSAYEQELAKYLRSKLTGIPKVQILANGGNEQSAIISFALDSLHSHDLSNILNNHGISIRTGHMCAHTFLKALGYYSVNRVSLGIYNTYAEVDYFLEILREILM